MNANDLARIALLQDMPEDEKRKKEAANKHAAQYAERFNSACERREIRQAGERAQWDNIIMPLLRSGKGIYREA